MTEDEVGAPDADPSIARIVADRRAELQNTPSAEITGVVFCGGESRRMGVDKALLEVRGRTLCEIACDNLEAVGLPVVLSTRFARREEYARRFPGRTLIFDDGRLPGPLGALLSVYRVTRLSLFVLAVDMPFVRAETLGLLLDRFMQDAAAVGSSDGRRDAGPAPGGICFGDERRIDPLCAIYEAGALERLDARIAEGPVRRDLQQLRTLLNLRVLAPGAAHRDDLRNLNSPEDLRDAGLVTAR